MPRGVYDRSKRRSKKGRGAKRAAPKSRILKEALKDWPFASRRKGGRKTVVKEIPKVVSVLKPPAVIAAFRADAKDIAGAMQRQSLVLSCSAAVCMIVGAHANGDTMTQADMIKRLKKTVAGTGLQESQTNKYIGLAKALVQHLTVRFQIGGPINVVLTTNDVTKARDALANYLADNKVTTLEGLTKLFGKYRRSPAIVKGRAPAGTVPGPAAPSDGEPRVPSPSIADNGGIPDPAQLRDGLHAQLSVLPTEFAVTTMIRAGHIPVQIGEHVVNFIESREDCAHLVRLFTDRAKHLDEVAAAVEARVHAPPAAAITASRGSRQRQRQRQAA